MTTVSLPSSWISRPRMSKARKTFSFLLANFTRASLFIGGILIKTEHMIMENRGGVNRGREEGTPRASPGDALDRTSLPSPLEKVSETGSPAPFPGVWPELWDML